MTINRFIIILTNLLVIQALGQNKKKSDSIVKLPPYQDSINSFAGRLKLLDSRKQPKVEGDAFTSTISIEEAALITQPHSKGSFIKTIPPSKSVDVYDYDNGYWLISIDSSVGYVQQFYLKEDSQMQDYRYNIELEALTERYGQKTAVKIMNHQIWYGMTKEMARASIGEPLNIEHLAGYYRLRQRWNYNGRYLIFENDFLLSWGY